SRDFTLECDICLVRVTVLEILGQGKCEWKDGKRESGGQVILVGKERTGSKRIKTLLIGEVKHARERVQDALENRRAVEVCWGIQSIAASGCLRNQYASGRRAARREDMYGATPVGTHGIESTGQQRMVVENLE